MMRSMDIRSLLVSLAGIILAIVGTWLVVGTMFFVFDPSASHLAAAFTVVALGAGVYRLCQPLLKKRASIWFSGAVAAALMLAAGIAYGLWRQ